MENEKEKKRQERERAKKELAKQFRELVGDDWKESMLESTLAGIFWIVVAAFLMGMIVIGVSLLGVFGFGFLILFLVIWLFTFFSDKD